ncbi:hypothetical protein [Nocardia nepalensis]|uniref:hypothetical protein n=1 Tax=Nocardia nepalensis TaxID=3375448 RepID=UPI003B66D2EA
MHARKLHPAQCRAALGPGRGRLGPVCCGARLDRAADPALITLQDKILDLLALDGPAHTLSAGRPTQPVRYFTDIQALALLACTTWPAVRHLCPSEDTAAAIDEHITSIRQ